MSGRIGAKWSSPTHAEAVRARIQTGLITDRLEKHILGKVKMQATQVTAALGLLRKVVPDLSATQHSGDPNSPIVSKSIVEFVNPK